jgi:hypothetical protein
MRHVRAFALVAGVCVGLFVAVGLVRAQAPRPGDTVQLWEYHTEVVRGPASPAADSRTETRRGPAGAADSMLNTWGRTGWELVGVTRREVRVDDTLESETFYVFKRPTGVRNR